jgi:hypothetical protein
MKKDEELELTNLVQLQETDIKATCKTMTSDINWPDFWTILQKEEFFSKNKWLIFKNNKFGCSI